VEPGGNTVRATSESSETDPLGRASIFQVSTETPMKSRIAIPPMTISVLEAFTACGRRNAGTPFEIASTPVRALHPDANARSTTISPTLPARPTGAASGTCAVGQPDTSPRTKPTATSAPTEPMNA
jgi:hypothetical protein